MKPLKTVSERLQDTLSMVGVPSVRIAIPARNTKVVAISEAAKARKARNALLEQYQSDFATIVRNERHFKTRIRPTRSRSAL